MAQEQLVPVDIKIEVEGRVIKDQFLWSADNTDVYTMRQFGLQILSEQFGRSGFSLLSQDIKRRFSQAVWELISYNVNLYNKLNMSKYMLPIHQSWKVEIAEGEAKNTENSSKSDLVNPIVKINLRLHKDDGELIEDSLFWDLTWNLNHPENFAKEYWGDLKLGLVHQKQVSFAIRKQIFDHLKQLSLNKKYEILKTLKIPADKHVKIMASRSWNKIYNLSPMEKSDDEDNDVWVPKYAFFNNQI